MDEILVVVVDRVMAAKVMTNSREVMTRVATRANAFGFCCSFKLLGFLFND